MIVDHGPDAVPQVPRVYEEKIRKAKAALKAEVEAAISGEGPGSEARRDDAPDPKVAGPSPMSHAT